MDPNTGHLVKLDGANEPPGGYERIPAELELAALVALGDDDETTVNLKQRTPLSKWAAKKRKARRKAAKRSRKANRSK